MAKRKDVSLLVSATGWIASFVGKVVELLRDQGISDEQIHALVTDDVSTKIMLDKIVDAISKTIKSVKNFYIVVVNYATNIEDLVKQGNYDRSDDNITTKNFSTNRTDKICLKIELVHFNRSISSDDAMIELDKMGFRPISARELLVFGSKYPDVQCKFKIVSLNDIWSDEDIYPRVLCLSCNGVKRNADLDYFLIDWDKKCRFAATRK